MIDDQDNQEGQEDQGQRIPHPGQLIEAHSPTGEVSPEIQKEFREYIDRFVSEEEKTFEGSEYSHREEPGYLLYVRRYKDKDSRNGLVDRLYFERDPQNATFREISRI